MTLSKFLALLAGLAGAAWAASAAEAQDRETRLYVQNTLSRDITVIDAERLDVIDRIFVGDYTDDVAAAPDGRTLYANAQIHGGNPFTVRANHQGKVIAYDTQDHEIRWSVGVEGSPHHLAVSPDGRRLYVPLHDRHYLLVIDTRTGEILDRWWAVIGFHGAQVSADGSRLYLGNMITDTLWAYDTSTGTVAARYNFGDGVRPIAFGPEERRVYVQLSRLHGFQVLDLASGEIARTVRLPELPADLALPRNFPHTYNHGIARTPDARYLLAAGSLTDYVAVFSYPDLVLVETVDVGEEPNWIVVDDASRRAFVSNQSGGSVSVIDLASLEEIARIPVGHMPGRMTLVDVPLAGTDGVQ